MEPYLGEIRIWATTYPPSGWAFCDGAVLQIAQASKVFELIGNAFGGDGRTNFALPDLRGRGMVGEFQDHPRAAKGGAPQHQVRLAEMPDPHSHVSQASSQAAASPLPGGKVLATANLNAYTKPVDTVTPVQPLNVNSISTVGGTPHENMPPYLGLTFCISMSGIYPSRPAEEA